MEEEDPNQLLWQIQTSWTMVFQAHQGGTEAAATAQQQLIQRYGGAVSRFLHAILPDRDAADEIAQEFALRFLRGDFARVDPRRGRLRDFVKTVLRHLVVDHHRRQRAQPRPLPDGGFEPVTEEEPAAELDRQFLTSWKNELIDRAWQGLARVEEQTRQPLHSVLRFREKHPELHSPQIAEQLGVSLGRPLTAAGVRQLLHRAREKFVNLLVQEVEGSLENPTVEEIEQELLDLGLLELCRPARARKSRKT